MELDEAEAFRFTARAIHHHVRGAHWAVGREQRPEIFYSRRGGQIADEKPRHRTGPASPTERPISPYQGGIEAMDR